MRFLGFLTLFCATAFTFLHVNPLHAQQGNPCDKATNTTDILSCAKDRYETAQDKLADIYKLVEDELKDLHQAALDQLSDEEKLETDTANTALDQLGSNQKDWIAYRDSHCAWASERADNESLKRIASLSCLADMTESRSGLLQKHAAEDSAEEIVAKNAATPRWINVLDEEKPHVFWKNAKRQTLDLDCDGHDDFAVFGIDEKTKEYVVAVAKSSLTGRPDVTVLDLSEHANEASASCALSDLISINDVRNDDELCDARLDIKGNDCENFYIAHKGDAFVIGDRRQDALTQDDPATPPLPDKKAAH